MAYKQIKPTFIGSLGTTSLGHIYLSRLYSGDQEILMSTAGSV